MLGRLFVNDRTPVTVKVDGAKTTVTVGELVRCYQKNAAADNRLRLATELLRLAWLTARL